MERVGPVGLFDMRSQPSWFSAASKNTGFGIADSDARPAIADISNDDVDWDTGILPQQQRQSHPRRPTERAGRNLTTASHSASRARFLPDIGDAGNTLEDTCFHDVEVMEEGLAVEKNDSSCSASSDGGECDVDGASEPPGETIEATALTAVDGTCLASLRSVGSLESMAQALPGFKLNDSWVIEQLPGKQKLGRIQCIRGEFLICDCFRHGGRKHCKLLLNVDGRLEALQCLLLRWCVSGGTADSAQQHQESAKACALEWREGQNSL